MSKQESKVKAPSGANARKKNVKTTVKSVASHSSSRSTRSSPPTNLKFDKHAAAFRRVLEYATPENFERAGNFTKSIVTYAKTARKAWDNLTQVTERGLLPAPPTKVTGLIEPRFDDVDAKVDTDGNISSSIGVAYSDMTKRYTRMVGSNTKMRIAMCEPLCHIGGYTPLTTAPNGCFIANYCLDGTTINQSTNINVPFFNGMALNPIRLPTYDQPTNSTYNYGLMFPDCQSIALIGNAFTRYRVLGNVTFHYEPQASTSNPVRCEFAYTEDPANPRIGLGNTGATPSSSATSSTPYSVAFAPWTAWSMTVPADNAWKYTYAKPAYGAGALNTAFVTSDLRDSCFGAISGVIIGPLSGYNIFGRLMIEYELEFEDPVPFSAFSTSLSRYVSLIGDNAEEDYVDCKIKLLRGDSSRSESKDPIDDDFPEPLTPRPSSLSSTPLIPATSRPIPLTVQPHMLKR